VRLVSTVQDDLSMQRYRIEEGVREVAPRGPVEDGLMENAAVVRRKVGAPSRAEELAAEEGRYWATTRRTRSRGRWMEGGRSSSAAGAGGHKRWTRLAGAWPEAPEVLPELQPVEQMDRHERRGPHRTGQMAEGPARRGRKAKRR
jgi:hypothetical protein